MKIACLSDLHIKKRDKASDFYFTDEELFDFFIKLKSECDLIVIDGDIFELWQGTWPTENSKTKEIDRIFENFPSTMALLTVDEQFILNYGNHDDKLPQDKRFNAYEVYTNIVSPKGSIRIDHGIRDFLNTKVRFIPRLGCWFVGLFERLFNPNIERVMNYWLDKLFYIEIVGTNKAQLDYFKKLIDNDDDLVCYVNGHTHKPQIVKFMYNNKERIFINTGFFNGSENYYCFIDTDTLELDPYKIIDTDFVKFEMTLNKGDILLTYKKENLVSNGIAFVTNSDYSHALMYVGGGRVIESTGQGCHITPVDHYFGGDYDLCRVVLNDKSKIDNVINNLHTKLGTKYGFFQNAVDLFFIAIKKITGKDFRKVISVDVPGIVCSELIAKAIKEEYGYDINAANFFPEDFLKYQNYFTYDKKITVSYK